jgi:hypothetical protein
MPVRHPRRARPATVESFEQRLLYSTYLVTGSSDTPGRVVRVLPGAYLATTLRAAVNAANAGSDADTIVISPTVGTIALTGGELAVTHDLAIQGVGANRQAIDAGGTSRVFNVRPGVSATIGDVTIANGNSLGTGGGDVRNEGTLTLRRVTVRAGAAGDGDGGGVFSTGTLTVRDSTFSGNTATSGGGLFNAGAATVVNSTFSANTADFGGGLYNRDGATLLVSNSTVSANRANQHGGGIASTLDDPSATSAGTRLNNTIVAGNTYDPSLTETPANPIGPDLYGFFDPASSNNLIGSLGFAKGLDASKNQLGSIENGTPKIDPMLSPLGYYGGTTRTMPPKRGSRAIDAGSNALVPPGTPTDQRGLPRIRGGRVDIGSVETSPVVTPPPPTTGGDHEKDGDKHDDGKKEKEKDKAKKDNKEKKKD